MYTLVSATAENTYGLAHYLCDTEADIADLPTNRKPGSKAFISTGGIYVLNNNKEWKKYSGNGGGGSSSGLDIEEVSSDYIQNLVNNGSAINPDDSELMETDQYKEVSSDFIKNLFNE